MRFFLKNSLSNGYYGERKMKINSSLYKVLVDKSSNPIFCFDRTGKYLYVNHAYSALFNKQTEDIIGEKIWDIFPGDEGNKRFDVVKYVFETGEMKVIESKIHNEGSLIYLVISVEPIKDAVGNVKMVLCSSKDISECKQTEEELKEREYLLRKSQKVAHIGSYVVDMNSTTWKCSEELNVILGIDETYPHTLEGWLQLIPPDWRTKFLNYRLKVDTEKLRFNYEYKIIRVNDGRERWVHGLGEFEFDEQGNAVRMMGTIQDITERKKAEEEIIYLSYHDKLTGLYNRRFYEEEIKRLDNERNIPISIIMADVNGLKLTNDAFGHSKGDELLKKAAVAIQSGCRRDDIIARWGGDEFIILLPTTETEEAEKIVKRIKEICSNEYVNDISLSISFGWDTKMKTDEDILKVLKSAENYMYNNKIIEKESLRGKTISTIINAFHRKNPREEKHSKRVSEICKDIGKAIGFSEIEISRLGMAGFLHDIGKIAIEEHILNKSEKLTEQEEDEIKQHPDVGYRILSSSYDMLELADYVYAHHERWDGTGYPKGLKGEAIPMGARIIAIAESYDAMIGKRPYGKDLDEEEVLTEIRNKASIQFDPKITRIFIEKVLNKPWN